MGERHMGDALRDAMQREPGVLEGGIASEKRVDQDAALARIDAEAAMAEPRNLHETISSAREPRRDYRKLSPSDNRDTHPQ
jgi:hypothetical protein